MSFFITNYQEFKEFFMIKQFDILPYHTNNAYYNMALDEVLFQSVINGKRKAAIRLYSWEKPSISIGYFQSHQSIDLQKCQKKSISIVRRMTGGRAVYHHNELTYCIVSQLTPKEAGQKKKVFSDLSEIILKGIETLGLQGKLNSDTQGDVKNPNCFQTKSICEIIDENRNKLVGSAMLIRDQAVIQQGSIPLDKSFEWIKFYLSNRSEELCNTVNAINHPLIKSNANSFIAGIKQNFDCNLISLDEQEKQQVQTLIQDKYRHDEWTFKK